MPSRREPANALRALSMNAFQRAPSGHPGAPMGMAEIAEVLWNDFLPNPGNSHWCNRHHFVLSNGQDSKLQYSLLHATGYDSTMSDLRQFRQLHSKRPGHPEYGHTLGVETTTGPLGQGLANAVGTAIAETVLAVPFNRPGRTIVDHHTCVFLSDGCLMEGIAHEVCSIAGTWGLGKLIAVYDDNGISIDGKGAGWFTDDTPRRCQTYGWHVIREVDGHDAEAVKGAFEKAHAVTRQPTLICAKIIIGFGALNVYGTHGVHGAPLGDEEIRETRERGARWEKEWNEAFVHSSETHLELARTFQRRLRGDLPGSWESVRGALLQQADEQKRTGATRKASQMALNGLGPYSSELIGGSADLTESNTTWWEGCTAVCRQDGDDNYIYYGVRELGMSAIINGIALHGGFAPCAGTFLVFSEHARNAVRTAAPMKVRNIVVYPQDSIDLGEDGPTHQPVEHLATLRLIPNASLWWPCDVAQTVVAWQALLERCTGLTCVSLSRQNLTHQLRSAEQFERIRRGGDVLRAASSAEPQAITIATGSEFALAVDAEERLAGEGYRVCVVSRPSIDTFLAHEAAYQDSVLPAAVTARLAIEAAVPDSWLRFAGPQGRSSDCLPSVSRLRGRMSIGSSV